MSDQVTIKLSTDEALVLHNWLARFNEDEANEFQDQAEQRVLWDIESIFERVLVEPFSPEYVSLLNAARSRVRDSDSE